MTLAEYTDRTGTSWRLSVTPDGVELSKLTKDWTWVMDVCSEPDDLFPDPEDALKRMVTRIVNRNNIRGRK